MKLVNKKLLILFVIGVFICCGCYMSFICMPVYADNSNVDNFENLFSNNFIQNADFADNFKKLRMKDKSELKQTISIYNNGDINEAPLLNTNPINNIVDDNLSTSWLYNYNIAPYSEPVNIHFDFRETTYLTGFEMIHNLDNSNNNYDGKMTWYKVYTRNDDSESWKLVQDGKMPKLYGIDYVYFDNVIQGKQFKIYGDVNLIREFNLYYIPVSDNEQDEMLSQINNMLTSLKNEQGNDFGKINKEDYDKIVTARDNAEKMPKATEEERLLRAQSLVKVAGDIKRSILVDVSGRIVENTKTAQNLLDSAVVGESTMYYQKEVYDDFKTHVDKAQQVIKDNYVCRGIIDDLNDYFLVKNRLFAKQYIRPELTASVPMKPYIYAGRACLDSLVDGADDRLSLDAKFCNINSGFHITFDYKKPFKFNGINLKIWQAYNVNTGLNNFRLKYKDANGQFQYVTFHNQPSGMIAGCANLPRKGTTFSVEDFSVTFDTIETSIIEFYPMDDSNKNITSIDEIEFVFADVVDKSTIQLDVKEKQLKEGDSFALNVESNFPYYAQDKTIIWSSSDNDLATVNNGIVKIGNIKQNKDTDTVTIYAYNRLYNDIKDSCVITVIKNLHTVKFVDENNEEIASKEISHGLGIIFPEQDPQKPDDENYTYTFDGWYNGEIKADNNILVNDDMILTAKFNKQTRYYKVTFDGFATSQIVEYNDKITQPTYEPEKADDEKYTYTFDGWYNGDEKWNFDENQVTGNIELKAKFIPHEKNIEIITNEDKGCNSHLDYTSFLMLAVVIGILTIALKRHNI